MAKEFKAPKQTRDSLRSAIKELQYKAMGPGIPIAQRMALKNRAQELRDQLIELEAARFNQATGKYKQALAKVQSTIADLRKTIKEIDNIIKIVEKAGKVFGAMDGLLRTAAKSTSIF